MKKAKSLGKLKAEAQKVFNEYIRLRDMMKPCISCGEYRKLQAGHFYSVKQYDGLRYNELNVHGECCSCNLFDEMHLLNYAANLPMWIGTDGCEELERLAKEYKKNGYKFSRTELEDIIKIYREKIKLLR